MAPSAESDAELAARLAGDAGTMSLALMQRWNGDGRMLGEEGDRSANRLLLEGLRDARPDDAILSEESRDSPERLTRSRVWIVDPIDGTREFAERREDWAVHVGLAVDGVARAGAVALPAAGLVLRSDRPVPLPPAPDRLRIIVSRNRPPASCDAIAARLGAEVVPMGSAGAKAMALVRGLADVYLHTGGQNEWDSCAPVAVAQAHGLHCSRIDGSPLVYNRADPSLPDLLICRAEHAGLILDTARECGCG